MTKKSAMKYANMLGRRMNHLHDEKDIDNILYYPYAFEDYDKEHI